MLPDARTTPRLRLAAIHMCCHAVSRLLPFWANRHRRMSYVARWFLPSLNAPIWCPTIYGFDLCLSKNGGHWVYYLGFYEAGTLHMLRSCLRPGDVFVDVGSSIGLMTNVASIAVGARGTVLSFEPEPERFTCLIRGLSHNERCNVRAFQVALGAEPKRAPLYCDRSSPSLVSVDGQAPGYEVSVETLDDVLRRNQIPRVHFAKIDVEGSEYDVLRGASSTLSGPHAPILCLEHNTTLPRVESEACDVLRFVLSINEYQLYQLRYSSHTISRLRKIQALASIHPKDNVYCLTPEHRRRLPQRLFIDK